MAAIVFGVSMWLFGLYVGYAIYGDCWDSLLQPFRKEKP